MEHIHVWISNIITICIRNGFTRKSVVRKFNCHIAFALIFSARRCLLFFILFFSGFYSFPAFLAFSHFAFFFLVNFFFCLRYPFLFCCCSGISSIFFVFTISMVFHFIVQLFRTIRSKHFLFEEAFFNCCTGRSYSLLLSQRSFFLVFPLSLSTLLSLHHLLLTSSTLSLHFHHSPTFGSVLMFFHFIQRVFFTFSDWNHMKSISFCWTFIHLPPGTLSLLNLPRLWK